MHTNSNNKNIKSYGPTISSKSRSIEGLPKGKIWTTNPSKVRTPKTISYLFPEHSPINRRRELFGFRRFTRTYILSSSKERKTGKKSGSSDISIIQCSSKSTNYYNCLTGLPLSKRIKTDPKSKEILCHISLKAEPKIQAYTADDSKYIEESHFANVTDKQRRMIIIRNIPKETGIHSIVAQISGGPIENFNFYQQHKLSSPSNVLKIAFIASEGAQQFMKYGNTNLFKVNGIHLKPEWFVDSNLCIPSKTVPSKTLLNYNGKCRCLFMKQLPLKDHLVLNSLYLKRIRSDFECFGEIVDISPLISRRPCLYIQFYDIYSAVRVLEAYEDRHSRIHQQYFEKWSIYYGKDLTDTACYQL
ncbi:Ssp2p NDAI_0E01190 [Naumovozyma dairenensis CBS 421]|uniref:RRM domain-containing protein n=1 Tax=Naumovozyma dairenensis (strain ATCC 10597 / BCRC 20456 / CBS 421 / NBRC 0211 / NRRL Y-12639) TaxID=1071378 RepID=G0WB15_NAUDC|nr:hypothetical protein NDAI_0E01190 [Naumovozyma dairenensis CBS 421]CCD24935.1 hypothetical protein NDAI_0E01190 [Naumovozyma dairenensis CBS 421]